ncbi:hypothetical protein [Geofilum rubicundum]|nr:hypothetical protein [Geofilum rubicundum]
MKKINTIPVILTFALILSLWLNLNARARLDASIAGQSVQTDSIKRYQSTLNGIAMFRDFEARSNGLKIDKKVAVVNLEGVTIPFSEIIDSNIRILKFSESNCSDCTQQNFQRVLDMMDAEMPDNLFLLGEFSNLRKVRIFTQMFELKWPVYYLPSSLDLPIDVIDEPYFFEVDESFTCSNFQIAASESTELVKSYLRALASKNN